jgi:hypothetical protein
MDVENIKYCLTSHALFKNLVVKTVLFLYLKRRTSHLLIILSDLARTRNKCFEENLHIQSYISDEFSTRMRALKQRNKNKNKKNGGLHRREGRIYIISFDLLMSNIKTEFHCVTLRRGTQ